MWERVVDVGASSSSVPGNGARKIAWWRVHVCPVGNPKRRVWWAQQQVFPQHETKVYGTSRRKNQLPKADAQLASRQLQTIYIWRLVQGVALHQQQRGTCIQYNQVLCPNLQWGCQSLQFAINKGLSISSGKRYSLRSEITIDNFILA
jgi:hypothetical protein